MSPMYNSDVVPDVTGRKLGSPDKQYDIYARNIIMSGSLTQPGGGNALTTNNSVVNTASIDIQSDTGTGGMLRRFRIKNDVGSSQVVGELQNINLRIGSEQAALGSMAPLSFLAAAAAVTPFAAFYRLGAAVGGTLASQINPDGSFTSFSPGYAALVLQSIASGEAQPRFSIGSNGQLLWGPGAAVAPDVGIDRIGVNALRVNNGAAGYGTIDLSSINFKVATGTAPFTVASSTKVTNLNADFLDGSDWASPGAIGSVTPGTGAFTSISLSGQLTSTVATGVAPVVIASTTPVPNLTVQRVDTPQFLGVIPGDTPAKKHVRQAIATLAAGARRTETINWATPFVASFYSIVANIFDSGNTGGAGLRIERQVGQSSSQAQFQIINDDTVAHSGVLHVQAELEFLV